MTDRARLVPTDSLFPVLDVLRSAGFMNILLITTPPLVMFLFFNRRIVAGLTAGAIKG